MKKIFLPLILFAIFAVLLSGCNLFAPKQTTPTVTTTEITYYQPTAKTEKFCDGANMDSEGFRKTITYETKATIPMANLSRTELIKQTLIYATDKSGFSIANTVTDSYLKIIGDTAYIQPIDGWAGVSIFLCYWKPYVEVNLLQFPEIKKVVWVTDATQWQELIEK